MPNFYFHVTMAYAPLRNAGVAIGKRWISCRTWPVTKSRPNNDRRAGSGL
jgi:hypothetical protein